MPYYDSYSRIRKSAKRKKVIDRQYEERIYPYTESFEEPMDKMSEKERAYRCGYLDCFGDVSEAFEENHNKMSPELFNIY